MHPKMAFLRKARWCLLIFCKSQPCSARPLHAAALHWSLVADLLPLQARPLMHPPVSSQNQTLVAVIRIRISKVGGLTASFSEGVQVSQQTSDLKPVHILTRSPIAPGKSRTAQARQRCRTQHMSGLLRGPSITGWQDHRGICHRHVFPPRIGYIHDASDMMSRTGPKPAAWQKSPRSCP